MGGSIPVSNRYIAATIFAVLILKEGFAALFIFVGDVGRVPPDYQPVGL